MEPSRAKSFGSFPALFDTLAGAPRSSSSDTSDPKPLLEATCRGVSLSLSPLPTSDPFLKVCDSMQRRWALGAYPNLGRAGGWSDLRLFLLTICDNGNVLRGMDVSVGAYSSTPISSCYFLKTCTKETVGFRGVCLPIGGWGAGNAPRIRNSRTCI